MINYELSLKKVIIKKCIIWKHGGTTTDINLQSLDISSFYLGKFSDALTKCP